MAAAVSRKVPGVQSNNAQSRRSQLVESDPVRSAFHRERSLPSGDVGPVERCAFARLAATSFAVILGGLRSDMAAAASLIQPKVNDRAVDNISVNLLSSEIANGLLS